MMVREWGAKFVIPKQLKALYLANTVVLLRRMPEDAWQRVGRHTESGPYSAEDWLKIYAEHLEIHSRQIDDNVAAWRAASGRPT